MARVNAAPNAEGHDPLLDQGIALLAQFIAREGVSGDYSLPSTDALADLLLKRFMALHERAYIPDPDEVLHAKS